MTPRPEATEKGIGRSDYMNQLKRYKKESHKYMKNYKEKVQCNMILLCNNAV